MKHTVTSFLAALITSALLPVLPLSPWYIVSAQAQSAVVLENLQFRGDTTLVRIPKMTVEGGNASKVEIEAFFDAQSLNTLAERLAKLSARSISIPLIEVTQDLADSTGVTSYKDIVLRDIRNGVITEALLPSTVTSTKAKPGKSTLGNFEMTMADSVMRETDLPLLLRFVYDKAKEGEALKTAIAEQRIGKTLYRIGGEMTVSIANISLLDLKLRPLKQPLASFVPELQKQAQSPASDRGKASLGFAADLLTAMSYGHMEMNGFSMDGKPPGSTTPVTFTMDRLSGSGSGDQPSRFSMQGLRVAANDTRVSFGEFTLDGVDLSALWGVLRQYDGTTSSELSSLDPRSFIPKLNVLRIVGVDIDVPDTRAVGQRIQAKLGLFETRMANFVGPVPANVGITLDGLTMTIPPDTKEKGLTDILALGYKSLDIAMRYDQVWDETTRTLKLNEFSLKSAGMFSASAKTEIGNVGKEAFTLDKAVAAVAALGVSAKNLEVSVRNDGLFEKLLAQQAQLQKRKPDDVRAELAAGATLMAPLLLGDHPGAKLIGAALGKFIAEPKNIRIGAVAKGGGLGMADFVAVSDPRALLNKLDITASANE